MLPDCNADIELLWNERQRWDISSHSSISIHFSINIKLNFQRTYNIKIRNFCYENVKHDTLLVLLQLHYTKSILLRHYINTLEHDVQCWNTELTRINNPDVQRRPPPSAPGSNLPPSWTNPSPYPLISLPLPSPSLSSSKCIFTHFGLSKCISCRHFLSSMCNTNDYVLLICQTKKNPHAFNFPQLFPGRILLPEVKEMEAPADVISYG